MKSDKRLIRPSPHVAVGSPQYLKDAAIMKLFDDYTQYLDYLRGWYGSWTSYHPSMEPTVTGLTPIFIDQEELYKDRASRASRMEKAKARDQKRSASQQFRFARASKSSDHPSYIFRGHKIKENTCIYDDEIEILPGMSTCIRSCETEYSLRPCNKEIRRSDLPSCSQKFAQNGGRSAHDLKLQRIRELIVQLNGIPFNRAKKICNIIEHIDDVSQISHYPNCIGEDDYGKYQSLKIYLDHCEDYKKEWLSLPSLEKCHFVDALLRRIQYVMPTVLEHLAGSNSDGESASDDQPAHPCAEHNAPAYVNSAVNRSAKRPFAQDRWQKLFIRL